MGLLLSVDPGVRKCGVALFRDGVLVAAGLPMGDQTSIMNDPKGRGRVVIAMAKAVAAWAAREAGGQIRELAIEFPQVYGDRESQKGGAAGQNDLVHLGLVVGSIVAAHAFAEVTMYLPREWIGQVPKNIHGARILKRLTEAEIAVIPLRPRARDIDHNVVDGIGLGLFYLRRM